MPEFPSTEGYRSLILAWCWSTRPTSLWRARATRGSRVANDIQYLLHCAFSFSRRMLTRSWHVTDLLIDRLEGVRMARTRLVQSSLMTVRGLGERFSPSHSCGMSAFSMYEFSGADRTGKTFSYRPTRLFGRCAILAAGKAVPRSEFEDLPPVILERKLDAIIIDVKAVAEVNPPTKHELAPNRDVRNGVV